MRVFQLVCEVLETSAVHATIAALEALTTLYAAHDLLPFVTHGEEVVTV